MQVRGGGEQQMKPPVHFSLTQLHHGETSKIAFTKALDKQKGDFRHISINAVFFTCSAYVGALPAFIPQVSATLILSFIIWEKSQYTLINNLPALGISSLSLVQPLLSSALVV